jgi:hypothetical protein
MMGKLRIRRGFLRKAVGSNQLRHVFSQIEFSRGRFAGGLAHLANVWRHVVGRVALPKKSIRSGTSRLVLGTRAPSPAMSANARNS